jgi:hypothetical protein
MAPQLAPKALRSEALKGPLRLTRAGIGSFSLHSTRSFLFRRHGIAESLVINSVDPVGREYQPQKLSAETSTRGWRCHRSKRVSQVERLGREPIFGIVLAFQDCESREKRT